MILERMITILALIINQNIQIPKRQCYHTIIEADELRK